MKKSLLLAAAALVAISCSKREIGVNPTAPVDPNEVRFSSGGGAILSKVSVDDNGHSQFDVDDLIGIYVVKHGSKLDDGTSAFPSADYKNCYYKVTQVDPFDDSDPDNKIPATATFAYNDDDATRSGVKIFYMPGGVEYNYYAYYPTDNLLPKAMSATFTAAEAALGFQDQTELFEQDMTDLSVTSLLAYPGPMMYAYSKDADAASTGGQANNPVALKFKYANAKIRLDIEMDNTSGSVEDITKIELYAKAGLYAGYTFDLKQADKSTPQVLTQGTSNLLSGTTVSNKLYSYTFQNLIDVKAAEGVTTTKSHAIGYLVPATGIQDAVVRITAGNQVYKARLDKSTTGENVASGSNHLAAIEAGKYYNFKITVKLKEVNFTGTIEDWETVNDPTSGTGIPAE